MAQAFISEFIPCVFNPHDACFAAFRIWCVDHFMFKPNAERRTPHTSP
jgi:hypothetical protein